MTRFNIDCRTERADRIFVEVDRRFNLAIIRTDPGLVIEVYPRTDGELWCDPFATIEVDEAEITELETAMEE